MLTHRVLTVLLLVVLLGAAMLLPPTCFPSSFSPITIPRAVKGQGGDGDLPSIPGITGPRQPDTCPARWSLWMQGLTLAAGLVGAALIVRGFGLSRKVI